jgi:hypothetical protein
LDPFFGVLQKEDERPHVIQGCRVLETTSMKIFATNGGRLITELVLDNFEFVPKTVFPFPFVVLLCVIKQL